MKLVVFTSDSIRHKYLANTLSKQVDDTLVISEIPPTHNNAELASSSPLVKEHFALRKSAELRIFKGNENFLPNTITLQYKEASSKSIFLKIKNFIPDVMIVFGSSILKGDILSLLPGKFLNLHLGLSPYYRGSGTNFWPFVNKELEYLGATILHINEGVDTGDIICHVIPTIELGDNVHTIGCKIIKDSVKTLSKIIHMIKNGNELAREKQWDVKNPKYYRNSDFTESILKEYHKNLEGDLIQQFLESKKNNLKIVELK